VAHGEDEFDAPALSSSHRADVSPGEADGAERLRRPGLHAGEPEHPGVLPGPGEQCVVLPTLQWAESSPTAP